MRYYDLYTASGNLIINEFVTVTEVQYDGSEYITAPLAYFEDHFDVKFP